MISATRSLAVPSSGIRGTSRYLACELLEYRAQAVGHTMNSDVWAFGMTAFVRNISSHSEGTCSDEL